MSFCHLTIVLILFILTTANNEFQRVMNEVFIQNNCQIPSKSTKIAIWTMTRLRVGQKDLKSAIQFFQDFLTRYAESQCQVFDSIYLIWNNELAPESYGLTSRKQHWKKKVYFLHTQVNNLDFRYIVPEWVQEEVLINLDDDAIFDCESMKNALSQYNSRSIGGFGPMAGIYGRSVNYNGAKDVFENAYREQIKVIYNYVLPGLAIIPKHAANLYYSKIFEFQKVRQITSAKLNCEDIATNFMMNSLYDDTQQFLLQNVKGKLINSNFELSWQPGFEDQRIDCCYRFSQIFGKNPNEFFFTNDSYLLRKKRDAPIQSNPCLTLFKKTLIQKKYFTNEPYFLHLRAIYAYGIDQEQSKMIERENKILRLEKNEKINMAANDKIRVSFRPKYDFKDLFKVDGTSQFQQEVKKRFPHLLKSKENSVLTDYKLRLDLLQASNVKLQITNHEHDQLYNQIFYLAAIFFVVFILSIIVFFKVRLMKKCTFNQRKALRSENSDEMFHE